MSLPKQAETVKPAHTPGPWTAQHGSIYATNKYVVAKIDVPFHMHNEITDANARLLAAAPDMKERGNLLASCAHDFLEEQTDINAERLALAVEGWNAAIAKAEGRP
jgi:hypothetical protein